jgi:hypothetical protein
MSSCKNISDELCGIPHLKFHNHLLNDITLSDEVDCVEKRKEKRFIINLFHAFLQHA